MFASDAVAAALLGLYALDRALKGTAVARFFARPAPAAPDAPWPSVALIQPITRGATNLAGHLAARAALDYAGEVRHVLVCDETNENAQAACRAALPQSQIVLVAPDSPNAAVASKIAKMTAGLAAAQTFGDVICFVDDDIALPPRALQILIAHLYQPGAGVAFGLACQSSWNTRGASLMSAFVNANALTGYVPLTFLTDPYTVTGHCFALRRAVFDNIGGINGLAGRFDDDHEIARRVRGHGLRAVQTPLVYEVENDLPTLGDYFAQFRRWFVIPRLAMLPYLTRREKIVSTLLSAGNLLPLLLFLLALAASPPRPVPLACALGSFGLFAATYFWCEAHFLPRRTPARRWLLLPVVAFLTPLHVLLALALPGNHVTWRGQRLHLHPGGKMEVGPS